MKWWNEKGEQKKKKTLKTKLCTNDESEHVFCIIYTWKTVRKKN